MPKIASRMPAAKNGRLTSSPGIQQIICFSTTSVTGRTVELIILALGGFELGQNVCKNHCTSTDILVNFVHLLLQNDKVWEAGARHYYYLGIHLADSKVACL
jgi:hypothetical protein